MASNVTLVRAVATITFSGNVTADDAFKIGNQTYVFKASPSSANDVDVGGTLAASIANLAAAVNGTGTEGTEYAADTAQPGGITASAGATVLTLTAQQPGTIGNSLHISEVVDSGTVATVVAFASGAGSLDAFLDGLLDLNQINSEVVSELRKLTSAVD